MKSVISWNVNGIRAIAKKGFLEWLSDASPDLLCLQETKAQPEQLDQSLIEIPGYYTVYQSAGKKGYSGVAVYSREEPKEVGALGIGEFDSEGRTCIVTVGDLTVISGYFPNSQPEGRRLDYKLRYCNAILELAKTMAKENRLFVLCGDYNISHKAIDLARPKANETNPGYLPEEREWIAQMQDTIFMEKPFSPNKIVDAVEKYIEDRE